MPISVLVSFSAMHLFPLSISHCNFPEYDETAEVQQFNEPLGPGLWESIEGSGAIGYFADGCGLNYLLQNDKDASMLIQTLSPLREPIRFI